MIQVHLGLGLFLRTEMVIDVAFGAKKLMHGMNNKAKAQAAISAIKMASKLSIPKLHLEGDSLIITNAISKGEALAWIK